MIVASSLLQLVDGLKLNLDALQPMGLTLAGFLAVIRIVQDGFRVASNPSGGGAKIISYLMVSVFIISVTAWLLNDGSENLLVVWVQSLTDSAASVVLGGQDLYDTEIFQKSFNQISDAISAKLDRVNEEIGITNFPEILMNNIMFYMIYLLSYILTLVNQVVFLVVLILIKMVIKIPLMLMPVFLPFAILPETKQLAMNWFNFFLQCVLLKLVAAVLLGMLVQLLVAVAGQISAEFGDIMATLLLISAAEVAMFILLKKSPGIAQQLAKFRP